jgi:hypothetical protein
MSLFRESRRPRLGTPTPRPFAFYPQVEHLDERCLPNVSTVSTAAGIWRFVVDSATSSLTVTDPTGVTAKAVDGTVTPVRVVHGFCDPKGNIGVDLVYADSTAVHFENGKLNTVGTGFLDLSTAYGRKDGSIRIVAVKMDGTSGVAPFSLAASLSPTSTVRTGTLLQYDGRSISMLGANVRWASAYEDTGGSTGLAVSIMTGAGVSVTLSDSVSKNFTTLYTATTSLTNEEITDFNQTVSAQGVATVTVTYGDINGAKAVQGIYGTVPTSITIISKPGTVVNIPGQPVPGSPLGLISPPTTAMSSGNIQVGG